MSMDATSLPNDPTLLKELVVRQDATIDQQVSTIDALSSKLLPQLEHYIAQLTRARFGPRSEKLDPNQLALFEPPTEQPPQTIPAPTETLVKQHTRRGGGRSELLASLPRERIEHDLSESEKLCPGCGQMRERIGSETSEQLDYIPAQLKVIEHLRWKYACRGCQEHVATAAPAAKPIDRGLPGPGLLAQVAVGKFSDHLPLYRLEDIFARAGMEVPRSTLCRWARETADLLEPLYRLMAARVRRSRVIHTDDTPVPVLDPTRGQTRTGRFWVYCGDRENPYSVYDYHAQPEAATGRDAVPGGLGRLLGGRCVCGLRRDLRPRPGEASALLGPCAAEVLRGQGDEAARGARSAGLDRAAVRDRA